MQASRSEFAKENEWPRVPGDKPETTAYTRHPVYIVVNVTPTRNASIRRPGQKRSHGVIDCLTVDNAVQVRLPFHFYQMKSKHRLFLGL